MENSSNYSPVNQQSDIIQKIERLGGTFDPNSALPIDDQLFICSSLGQENFNPSHQRKNNDYENASDNAKWNDNGTYQRSVSTALTESKLKALTALKTCNYRTPPLKIAQLLDQLFIDYDSKPGHWVFIAQHYHPRAINWVITGMIKAHRFQWETIKTPPAYFTLVLKKYYKPRKKFRRKRK